MPQPFLDTDFAYWAPEGQPVRVEFPLPLMEEIAALALDGLTRFRHGGMEVGGVLFGVADSDVVRVLAFRPLECEYAYGPRFVLSERDRSRLKDLLYAPRNEADLSGLEPVGWYHSHTRSDIGLSPRDLEVYDSYFPQRWQVALIVRPEEFAPARAGFFYREPDGSVKTDSSYAEFSIDARSHGLVPPASYEASEAPPAELEPDPEPPVAAQSLPAVSLELPDPPPPTEPPPPPAPAEIPRFAQVAARPARRGLWLVLALVLAGAAGFGVERYYQAAGSEEPLSLWVADVGGQLLIEWDRSARPVRDASSGTLEIQDGPDRIVQKIDGDRLREGSVDYVRRSEVVDVRLRVQARGSRADESIRFIGPPVRRNTPADAELLRERDDLKATVEKLTEQIAARNALIRRLRARAK